MWKLKPTRRDSAPTLLVTVGAESFPAPWSDQHGGTPHVMGAAHVCVRRRTKAGWRPVIDHPCPGWADVWGVLDALGTSGRRVYVVAGCASDLLTQLHWWDRVERGIYSLRKSHESADVPDQKPRDTKEGKTHPLILHGRPDIIGYSLHQSTYRWVSVTNWADCSIVDMAKSVGYTLPNVENSLDGWAGSVYPARDQARVMMAYVSDLMSWWLENGCGSWRDTPGAAAWSSYLRRCDTTSPLRHDNPDALAIESASVFGGRASAFYLGNVGVTEHWGELADAPKPKASGLGLAGPFHRFDVRAMYPSLLRDRRYPVSLLRVDERCSRRGLRAGMNSLLSTAEVSLRTTDALYPRRVPGGAAYPTGTFRTVLTSPELEQAVEQGHLLSVHRIAWYTPGRPFESWATWVLHLRSMMKAANHVVGEAVVKALAVSFGGKLARRKMGWVSRPKHIPLKWWGDWWTQSTATGEMEQYRSLCGHVQQMERSEHRPGTFGACFAHLTAYGRVYMNKVRELCGHRHVIWQDTDGVIVDDVGRERIERSEYYHPSEYGKLRYERSFHNMKIITPKHYWADGTWVLAGIHAGFDATDGETASHVVTTNPVRSAVEPTASAVYRAVQRVDLTAIEPGVEIGPDGWAIPPRIGRDARKGKRLKGQGEIFGDTDGG